MEADKLADKYSAVGFIDMAQKVITMDKAFNSSHIDQVI